MINFVVNFKTRKDDAKLNGMKLLLSFMNDDLAYSKKYMAKARTSLEKRDYKKSMKYYEKVDKGFENFDKSFSLSEKV